MACVISIGMVPSGSVESIFKTNRPLCQRLFVFNSLVVISCAFALRVSEQASGLNAKIATLWLGLFASWRLRGGPFFQQASQFRARFFAHEVRDLARASADFYFLRQEAYVIS